MNNFDRNVQFFVAILMCKNFHAQNGSLCQFILKVVKGRGDINKDDDIHK